VSRRPDHQHFLPRGPGWLRASAHPSGCGFDSCRGRCTWRCGGRRTAASGPRRPRACVR